MNITISEADPEKISLLDPTISPVEKNLLKGLGRFCRPKSTTGSVVMTLSVCLAVISGTQLYDALIEILLFTSAIALWTITGHGVNQIYDIEADKINKPNFPLPSGIISVRFAWVLSISTGLVGTVLAFLVLPIVMGIPFFLGMTIVTIVYSVPRFGVRHSAWLPKFLGIYFRGIFFPMISYIGACEIAGIGPGSPEHLIFILIFAILFCVGMNTFEDIPDLEGDRLHGYASIAQRIGPVPTAYICLGAFTLAYIGLTLCVLSAPQLFSVSLGVLASIAFLALFCFRFRRLINELPHNIMAAKPFYRFLWQLYCAQYLLLPALFK